MGQGSDASRDSGPSEAGGDGSTACSAPDAGAAPCCLENLISPCRGTTPCTNSGTQLCYANGVVETTAGSTTTVTKNGMDCFSYTESITTNGFIIMYLDVSGQLVATVTQDRTAPISTVAQCVGEDPVPYALPRGGVACTAGTCN
jgi:hypothetical protein